MLVLQSRREPPVECTNPMMIAPSDSSEPPAAR